MRADLQALHPSSASRQILREALADGIIDWPLNESAYQTTITPDFLEWIQDEHESSGAQNTASWQNAGRSPKSLQYRDDSRGLLVHPDAVAPFRHWSVEVARFMVPAGSLGIVKAFEQYIAHQELDQEEAFVYSSSPRWGNPFPSHTGNTNELPDLGRWHFRLHQLVQTIPVWWEEVGPHAGVLPDLPYTDKPYDDLLWWPAGSAPSQNVHWPLQGGFILRVIWEQEARLTGARVEVACHLAGSIVSDSQLESAFNARTLW